MSWMTQTDAAAALGCSVRTIRRRIRRNTLNSRREGRNILVQVGPDETAAIVPSVSGRFSTTPAPSTAVLNERTADELAAMSTTLKDTVSALSDYHQTLHAETRQARRSARTARLAVTILALGLALGGWLYHVASANHSVALNDARQELVTTEARHAGERDAQQTTLQRERAKTMDLQGHNTVLVRQLAEVSAHRDRAAADRDTLTAQRDELAVNLGKAQSVASLANIVKDISSVAKLALRELAPADELQRLRNEVQTGQERHQRELADAEVHYAQLARSSAHREGELQALEQALAHERRTVGEAQEGLERMAHKLIAAATDRARLELERDHLTAQIDTMKTELRTAKGYASLRAIVKDFWSIARMALARTVSDGSAMTTPVSSHSKVCDSDTSLSP